MVQLQRHAHTDSMHAAWSSNVTHPPTYLCLLSTQSTGLLPQDGTLVNPKGKTTFARSADDYKFWNKKVVKTIQGFHDDGYKIVIFT